MRFVLLLVLALASASLSFAAEARVVKVLQHLEDSKKRIALSPSLYERDAYQHYLRDNPDMVRALRFEVFWKANTERKKPLTLRIETVTEHNTRKKPAVFEEEVFNRGWRRNWTTVRIDKETYSRLGRVIAWRALLLDGERVIAEHKSFLWDPTREQNAKK